ncbi:MAG TPA: ABC transporter permease [Candidatus Angelobacter sp.]|nr:ABC transporter permease [Candidatus Angelobacter sp.]
MNFLHSVVQDLRYSFRILIKNPLFGLAVISLLTIGIAAATTIFSVVNSVLIRPLPFHEPDRLIRIWESSPSHHCIECSVSVPDFNDWQSQQSTFDELAATEMATFNLTGYGEPVRVAAATVTTNMFRAMGTAPVLGRDFLPEEGTAGKDRVALLSYGLWQRQFGGDQRIVNTTIQLDDTSYLVLGILPQQFQFPGAKEIFVPLVFDAVKEPWRAYRARRSLEVYGRLKAGISLDQARADMNTVARRIEQAYKASNEGWGIRLRTVPDWIVPEPVHRSLLALLIAVGLLLLIACANVASLFLARATSTMRVTAIRAALGASRIRVMQQLLTESLFLSALGGLGALFLTFMSTKLIASSNIKGIAGLEHTRIDGNVLVFALGISVITGLIFGLAPAWWASRSNLNQRLNEGRSGSGASKLTQRMGVVLVVVEVTLALALLVTAGLMMRSFVRLQSIALGFAPENVLTVQVSLPTVRYAAREQRVAFFNQFLERVRTIPGVEDAAAITQPPSTFNTWGMEIILEDKEAAVNGLRLSAAANAATPHYFHTLGIPIIEGREFNDQDGADKQLNLIVSESFARRYWPNQDAIGKRFRPAAVDNFGTIVGVVDDATHDPESEAAPAFYFPYAYIGMQGVFVMVRSNVPVESLIRQVRDELRGIDSKQPVYNMRTMDQIVANTTIEPRFRTVLLGGFSVVALFLAATGVYSVLAYLVRRQWHEIGVRMALGAQASDIRNMVLTRGMFAVFLGILLGLGACFAFTRLLSTLLFRVSPTDPVTFIGVALLITAVEFAACYIPAIRATRVSPSTVLKYE